MSRPIRVIKLGGSLFDLPNLGERFSHWLSVQPRMTTVMIVGGGKLVDVIRDWDRDHQLGDEASHSLAVEALALTAALAQQLFQPAELCSSLATIQTRPDAPLQILDPREFMWHDSRQAEPLPKSWNVTSDSIAAKLALKLEASELVLLKSVVPRTAEVADWVAQGVVDSHFAQLYRGQFKLRLVDLRQSQA